jgi:hypothetical protein
VLAGRRVCVRVVQPVLSVVVADLTKLVGGVFFCGEGCDVGVGASCWFWVFRRFGLVPFARPRELGPLRVRVLPVLQNRLEEDTHEEATTTPEQIVRKLREADRMLADGIEVPEVAKARWRSQSRRTTGGVRNTVG